MLQHPNPTPPPVIRRGFLAILMLMLTCNLASAQFLPFQQPQERATLRAVADLDAYAPGDKGVLAIQTTIAPSLHSNSARPLTRNLIPFVISDPSAGPLAFGTPQYPPGTDHTYPGVGTLNVYTGTFVSYVPFEIPADAPVGTIAGSVQVQYQICDNKGFCFAPEQKLVRFEVRVATSAGSALEPTLFAGYDPAATRPAGQLASPPTTPTPPDAQAPAEWTFALALGAAVLIGVLFNVMPCVLPVLPLKALGFYEVAQHNRARTFMLGLVFSAGIIVVFAILGQLVVVLRWLQWGELFANPWFLGTIVAILLIMALSLFDVFEVVLPASVLNLSPRHDTVMGNFLHGILAAILSTPCTFGMFVGLLAWMLTQPAAVGITLMVAVGFGMALPYLLLSAFPQMARKLPRSGPVAVVVKQMMGFLLLGSAVFFARSFIAPLIGSNAFWWILFAVVLAGAGWMVYKSARFRTTTSRVVAGVLAVLLSLGWLWYTLQAIHQPVEWRQYATQRVDEDRQRGIVVLEYTADWCVNCIFVEQNVLKDPRVVSAFRQLDVAAYKVDLTHRDAPGWASLRQLSAAGGIPLTVIYSPRLSEPIRLPGIYSTQDLLDALQRARG